MLPKNVLYYGKEEPLPEQIPLRAGPLSLIYEEGDLRYIKLGDREILRRVYVAVRDRNWDTILPVLSNVQMDVQEDSFRITYDVDNKQGDIDFFWQGTITGDAQGTIAFSMEGRARSTFLRNRIGFCVLHPMRCAGASCLVEKVDGSGERGQFPVHISPYQPFLDMQAISHEVMAGLWAEVRFAGEVFEIEDQRNWTDASYKTYCTPLSLPFPVEVKEGTEIKQSVTLALQGEIPQIAAQERDLMFVVDREVVSTVPRLGLGVASHGQPLSDKEMQRLRALNLSHLRVDLDLQSQDFGKKLAQAWQEAEALDAALEVALHLSDDAEAELNSLMQSLLEVKPRVWAWLIFHKGEKSTRRQWIELARQHLTYQPDTETDPTPGQSVPLYAGGTNAYFTELNRERPPVEVLDLVTYSINPQVHAFDNASLAESLEAQAVTVESARQFVGDRPLAISPVTLKPRFNPNATGPEPEPGPGELPSQVDERQMSLFGAGWTAGSIKYLSNCSLTYYETTGWRGVMETAEGSSIPSKFRHKGLYGSLPGAVFPLYHVLADVAEFDEGAVLRTTTSDPLRVDGLALQKAERRRVILANLSPHPQQVKVHNLGSSVQVRYLDENNVAQAMQAPEEFRSQAGEPQQTNGGELTLDLLPYAVTRIDWTESS